MACLVEEHCKYKSCKDPKNKWNNESNCTCKGCIERSKEKHCEMSGDPYNTDFDCIMEK